MPAVKRTRLIWLAALPGLFLAAGAAALLWYAHTAPAMPGLLPPPAAPSTKILARDGRLLYEVASSAGVHHTPLTLAQIPSACRQATIATEDATFYSNPGVEWRGILRALWINVRGGQTIAGGSTITQQVVRNLLLPPAARSARTLERKLHESLLAWRLTRTLPKARILELYLNNIDYGNLALGLQAAAQTYFGKDAAELDLAECALLAGLPQAPAQHNPLANPAAAQTRQRVVLGLMHKAGFIDTAGAAAALREPLQYAPAPFPITAPHFVFQVLAQLQQQYGAAALASGLTVTTTLDIDLTHSAEQIMRRRLAQLADSKTGSHNSGNAALVAVDPRTGQVLALVGSIDYFDRAISGAINMALAPRQPGSTLKPLTYALAFDPARCPPAAANCPWTAATQLPDLPTSFVTTEGRAYTPQNYDRKFRGPVLARAALGNSLNIPAVLALQEVGVAGLQRMARAMGITTLAATKSPGLALTLGGGAVRLTELTAAYGVFATGGMLLPQTLIMSVHAADGTLLSSRQPIHATRALDARIAFIITNILADNNARSAAFGAASVLNIGRPAAVKTGTTTNWRDNWTVGYTPELAVGVWVGNADNSPMRNVAGISGAAPIWHDFMRTALRGKAAGTFMQPAGLVRRNICAGSGAQPTATCIQRTTEIFISGTEPRELIGVDAVTEFYASDSGLLAANLPAAREPAAVLAVPASNDAQSPIVGGAPQLRIAAPDAASVYRLSARLPAANQLLPLRILSAAAITNVTILMDGEALAQLSSAPFEVVWQLAAGRHRVEAFGTAAGSSLQLHAPPVEFIVLAPDS
ncbi:penicillin-binding protein 1A [Anaerolineaceae bacterium]|nr:penicillin-binding protein 1A [Anaerolineaceae bacterium]